MKDRIKFALFVAALYIDVALIDCTARVLYYCKEWFSWSSREIGRCVLSLWPGAMWAMAIYYAIRPSPLGKWYTFFLVCLYTTIAVGTTLMACLTWRADQSRTAEARLFQIVYPGCIIIRVTTLLFAISMNMCMCALPPHTWRSNLTACAPGIGLFFMGIYAYIAVIPTIGQKGRRRKEALAKIKEMFNPGWMPAPQGEPS